MNGMTEDKWNAKEKRQQRGMCLSYAKDLAIANKIEVEDIEKIAKKFVEFIWE